MMHTCTTIYAFARSSIFTTIITVLPPMTTLAPLVDWPIFIINEPSLKRISLFIYHYPFFILDSYIHVLFFYIHFRTRIFFRLLRPYSTTGPIVPRNRGSSDVGCSRRRVYRGYSKATTAVVGVVCTRRVYCCYTLLYIFIEVHIYGTNRTHTHSHTRKRTDTQAYTLSSSLLVRIVRVTCAYVGVRVAEPLLTTPLHAQTLHCRRYTLVTPAITAILYALTPYIPHAALKTDDQPRTLHTRATTCLLASYSLSLHTHTYTHTYTFLLLFTTLRTQSIRRNSLSFQHCTPHLSCFYSVKLVLLYTHGYYTFMTTLVYYTNLFTNVQYTYTIHVSTKLTHFRNVISCNKI